MPNEKRMIDKFEIIHAIQVGAREVVVGISPEREFMCCFCTQDGRLEHYADAMVSNNYLEIMGLYADRLKKQITAVQAMRSTIHVPLTIWDAETLFKAIDLCDDDILKLAIDINYLLFSATRLIVAKKVNWLQQNLT